MIKKTVGSKSLIKNAGRNLLGQGFPLVVAFYCIPQLIFILGAERFGFLTLIWVIVGYLSIFDLGLGQALTKLVADYIGRGELEKIPPVFWTAMLLMCGLGMVGMLVFELSIPYLIEKLFKLPGEFEYEAKTALSVAAISLPMVIVSTGSRGVLEAFQRFDLVNKVRIPLGIYTFVTPLLVANYFSKDLSAIAAVLVFGRLMFMLATIWICFEINPSLRSFAKIDNKLLKPLFSFGGWMTLTNIIGPLMVYLDRFVIGSAITMAAVAYYVTPYELITKLWIFPSSLIGVLFSAFSINLAHVPEKAIAQYRNSMTVIFILMLPIILLVIIFADIGLKFWLGTEFATHSVRVFQILAIGVFINSFGRVPFIFIQAAGRPDIPSMVYLIELPLYLFGLWYMLGVWGVEGAAAVWVARIVLDNLILLLSCTYIEPLLKQVMYRGIFMSILPCLMLPFIFSIENKILISIIVISAIALMVVGLLWSRVKFWHSN